MIVLGNPDFATAMRLAGIKESYIIKTREDALQALKGVDKKSFIMANAKVMELVPELKEFVNVVSIPDDAKDFSSTDDLKDIIKNAVGMELKVI
jgi:vacuolar-type H+-ATPase subunit F/Vma7